MAKRDWLQKGLDPEIRQYAQEKVLIDLGKTRGRAPAVRGVYLGDMNIEIAKKLRHKKG